jgi:hypothetical protein
MWYGKHQPITSCSILYYTLFPFFSLSFSFLELVWRFTAGHIFRPGTRVACETQGEGWQDVVGGTVVEAALFWVRERRREGVLQLRYCYNQHALQSLSKWTEPYPMCILLRIARTKNMDSKWGGISCSATLCKSCNASWKTNSCFPFARLLRPVQTFQ